MDINGWLQICLLFTLLLALTKPLGLYLYKVYETPQSFKILTSFEKRLFKLLSIEGEGQDWKSYASSLILFNILGIMVLFLIQTNQELLPLNPQNLAAVPWDLALNTAVSFVTHTNWQAYSGETSLSQFTQMVGLTWQNFCAAGTGLAVFLALARGFSHQSLTIIQRGTLGNFWVDLIKSILYVLLPLSVIFSLFLVSQGVIQNFSPTLTFTTLEGTQQSLAMGPVASQEAIKLLGTNGGGFFNANSAHPFENPTPLSNFFQMLALVLIPAALTYTYGKMTNDTKQGWSLLAAMVAMALMGAAFIYYYESQPNPLLNHLSVLQEGGNLEGKETRFGIAGSSLFANLATDTSGGSSNAMYDSFTPLGGMILLINMLLGEVVFGGVGVGLFGMLMFVVLSIFIAGLMVGRIPEYLGKKIEGKEVRFAVLYIALYPFLILLGTAWSVLAPFGLSSLQNPGAHGLSEILYAYTSAAQNNGSAFAGLNANTLWYNLTLALVMFLGRFGSIFLGLAIAGTMVNKKIVQASAGTFPSHGILFVCLLIGIILIVSALTYFPVLMLGPFTEHLYSMQGKMS
ncbi:MAG: potassium-transporting ATPase subunit KdpA [Alphaproteobacteria bacterium]|nr:potassium-transporting ATPase subunit KdpA [Alphaproteobacteria bacterium]